MSDPKAANTYSEIVRQPEVWRELQSILESTSADTASFLAPLLEKENLRIVLTGAGTSAFVGQIAAPALMRATSRRVEAVATTEIVSNPREMFGQDVPTLLVSFARSGNSPESVAATDLADQVLSECYHLVLTCAKEGELAQRRTNADRSHVVLMPERSNDSGFAMTSSFTCMLLSSLIILGPWAPSSIEALAASAEDMIATRQDEIQELAQRKAHRVVYLGSGPLRGLAHEAGLKYLELTAGDLVSFYESSLGFRHGPKAVIEEGALAIVFVSSDPYTRKYDLDIINELRGNLDEASVLAVAASSVDTANAWVWKGLEDVDDALAAAVHVVAAQLLGVFTSAALGKTVDNPFPAGDVNRVVKGVVIHELEG